MFGRVETVVVGKGAEFGEKAAVLLEGVRDNGSLHKTANALPMAYSNAWLTMNSIDDAFGFKFIERDGARGSTLTERGLDFLQRYRGYQADVAKASAKAFEKRFGDWR